MKRLITCLIALALIVCAVVSVSAEASPTASVVRPPSDIIDVNPVINDPNIPWPPVDNPVQVIINDDGTIKLISSSKDGYKFSHWEFISGNFEFVEGDYTTPVIVIRPTTTDSIKVNAHFTDDEATITRPTEGTVYPPSDNPVSPVTGDAVAVYGVAFAVVSLAVVALVIAKKKSNA